MNRIISVMRDSIVLVFLQFEAESELDKLSVVLVILFFRFVEL